MNFDQKINSVLDKCDEVTRQQWADKFLNYEINIYGHTLNALDVLAEHDRVKYNDLVDFLVQTSINNNELMIHNGVMYEVKQYMSIFNEMYDKKNQK